MAGGVLAAPQGGDDPGGGPFPAEPPPGGIGVPKVVQCLVVLSAHREQVAMSLVAEPGIAGVVKVIVTQPPWLAADGARWCTAGTAQVLVVPAVPAGDPVGGGDVGGVSAAAVQPPSGPARARPGRSHLR